MGIIEKELSNFNIEDLEGQIELNRGEILHVHIGNFRLDLTIKEFKEFAEVIEKSSESLSDIKNET